MRKEFKSLIGLLFDISADPGSRDDAPFYLREYEDHEALEALIKFAENDFVISGDDPGDVRMLKRFMWRSDSRNMAEERYF